MKKSNYIGLGLSKKVWSYPKVFKKNSKNACNFDWSLNNCKDRLDKGEDILELPLYWKQGNELFWSMNTKNNNPVLIGKSSFSSLLKISAALTRELITKEYYVVRNSTATYCAAYSHTDTQPDA